MEFAERQLAAELPGDARLGLTERRRELGHRAQVERREDHIAMDETLFLCLVKVKIVQNFS